MPWVSRQTCTQVNATNSQCCLVLNRHVLLPSSTRPLLNPPLSLTHSLVRAAPNCSPCHSPRPLPMKALVQSGYGAADQVLNLSTSQPPPPPPTSTQVQVRVHAASNSPHDWKALRGHLKLLTSLHFPHVPGCELAGVVVAVGSAVRRLKVGDAVIAWNNELAGAYAELVNVPEAITSLKPNSVEFTEAAMLPLAAQSALGALESARLVRGEKVVVIGASGGVGSYAVSIAKLMGASRVVAVASSKNAEYVKSLGADQVVDYSSTKLSEALAKEFDVVLDCVGGEQQWDEARRVLNKRGRFVTIVGNDPSHYITVAFVFRSISHILYRKLATLLLSANPCINYLIAPSHKLQDRVVQWVECGELRNIRLEKVFEFDEQGATRMYTHVESGRTVGKVVMQMVKE